MKLFANITKRDDEKRMVWGTASTESMDSQGEIVKLDAVKGAWEDYMKFANIREMHQPSAVGKCKEYEFDDKGVTIGVKVVDDNAWKKVVEGVYSGFSIGGKAVSKVDGVIHQLRLTEISLVDRPANPEALITVFKADDVVAPKESTEESTNEAPATEQAPDITKYAGENIQDAATALQCLDALFWLLRKESTENGEPADQVTALTAAVANLKAFIASEIMEPPHNDEMKGEMKDEMKSENPDDMAKGGMKYSKETRAELAGLHDEIKKCGDTLNKCSARMDKMGYADAMDNSSKAETVDDVQKLVDEKTAVIDEIVKIAGVEEGALITDAVAKMKTDLDEAKAKIAKLEAEPEKPTVRLNGTGVEKSKDGLTEQDEKMAVLEKKAEDGTLTPADLLKHIHVNGGRRLA